MEQLYWMFLTFSVMRAYGFAITGKVTHTCGSKSSKSKNGIMYRVAYRRSSLNDDNLEGAGDPMFMISFV